MVRGTLQSGQLATLPRPGATVPMNRRRVRRSIALALPAMAMAGGWVAVRAQPVPTRPPPELERIDEALSLYGVALKDASVDSFVAAARAAGGVPIGGAAGTPPRLDMRAAGVPALERLTVVAHEGRLASAQFTVKGYGQDNVELRQMLVAKYGPPLTVSPRPLRFGGFDQRAAPRGAYQWLFSDGMRLVYDHPRVGDVTLSYVDDARMDALAAAGRPGSRPATSGDALRDRL